MPVPKRRTSRSKVRKRRSHDALTAPQTVKCKRCGQMMLPHRVCDFCGYYAGRMVISKDTET